MTTETPEVVTEATPEEQARADLQAGFDLAVNGETPPAAEEAPPAEAAPPPEEPAAVAPPEDEDAKPVTLTAGELKTLRSALDELKQNVTKVHTTTSGKLGEFNQALRDLKATAGGRKVTLEQFKDVAEEYDPRLAELFVNALNTGGTPPEAETKVPDISEAAKALQEKQDLLDLKIAIMAEHPDAFKVTNTPQFIAWRDAKPEDERKQIAFGRDANHLVKTISDFKAFQQAEADKAEKAKPKPKPQLERAITPQGSPPAVRSPQSARTELQKGFDSVG